MESDVGVQSFRMDFRKIENALEEERRRLMTQVQKIEGALYALANVRSGAVTSKPGEPGKRTMSAAARKRISMAQKARWAKLKRQK